MAKAPTPGRYTPPGAKDKSTAPQLFVGFDGEEWGFNLQEVSPRDGAEVSKVLGYGPTRLIQTLFQNQDDVDLHTAAGLIFLARRQSEGQWVTWAQATEGLTYGSAITMRPAEEAESVEEEEIDSPEA